MMNRNPLPGIPIIESPLYEGLRQNLGFSEFELKVADDLNKNGVAVIDFPDAEIGQRCDRIKEKLGPLYNIDLSNKDSDKTVGQRRLQDAWAFDEDVKKIASNEAIMHLLGKLYGRPAFPFQTLNFPVGTQQDAHSDSVHFSSLPERFMCGVWLAMEDVHPDAGPVFYLPGSHRWPVMTNAVIGRRGFDSELQSAQDPFAQAWQALSETSGLTRTPFLARKGQALIWSANLLHGGSRQIDPTRTRWSQVTHYYFEDCIYYTPAFSDETIGKLKLREIRAINDGRLRPNQYQGEIVYPPANARGAKSVGKFLSKLITPRH